jgi:hypothetical protein
MFRVNQDKNISISIQTLISHAGPEVLTAVVMKSPIFWDITPFSPLKVNQRFGGTCYLSHTSFLLGLFLNPEDGGDMFLRNFERLSADYTALYP